MGGLGGGQKAYVDKVYVVFPSPSLDGTPRDSNRRLGLSECWPDHVQCQLRLLLPLLATVFAHLQDGVVAFNEAIKVLC